MDTQYLRSNVAECLTASLAELAIKRPSDPIAFLAETMLKWQSDRNPAPSADIKSTPSSVALSAEGEDSNHLADDSATLDEESLPLAVEDISALEVETLKDEPMVEAIKAELKVEEEDGGDVEMKEADVSAPPATVDDNQNADATEEALAVAESPHNEKLEDENQEDSMDTEEQTALEGAPSVSDAAEATPDVVIPATPEVASADSTAPKSMEDEMALAETTADVPATVAAEVAAPTAEVSTASDDANAEVSTEPSVDETQPSAAAETDDAAAPQPLSTVVEQIGQMEPVEPAPEVTVDETKFSTTEDIPEAGDRAAVTVPATVDDDEKTPEDGLAHMEAAPVEVEVSQTNLTADAPSASFKDAAEKAASETPAENLPIPAAEVPNELPVEKVAENNNTDVMDANQAAV